MTEIINNPSVKHDALFLFDVMDSNPNGDPDNAGKPRTDLDTGQGLASDVSLKRKIRDSVAFQVDQGLLSADRFGIFIRRGESLNKQLLDAYNAVGQKPSDKPTSQEEAIAAEYMIKHFFDVRMFGAVMSTGEKGKKASAGKVTGPVTVGIARSVDPVMPMDMGITRVASTKEEDRDNASQMGNKTVIPYGLYAARIHYQPTRNCLVTEDDMVVLWKTLKMMFEWTRSSARPDLNVRGIFVFSHDNALGNAPAHTLFEMVSVFKVDGIEIPRSFADYIISEPDSENPFEGVTYSRLV